MAIGDDFSVNTSGDIRHVANNNHYTVLELHRWLQDLADNASTAGGSNDVLDITSTTPSERSTDQIITLLGSFNIDDTASEYFYGGSIKQGTGATETVYSGLKVLGSVVSSATQLQVVQDKALYDGDAPFWGTQATPYNGGGSVLMRILIKSREYGCNIDGQQVIVQARHYGDSYAFFSVTLGEGEAVAAVSSVDDPQNDTAQGTVTAYTHVTNTEGFQTIDIGDGNGVQPYYSQWTYGADTSGDQLKGVWEFIKDLTYTGTAKTIHGIDGELFRGVTHTYSYDNLSGSFTEDNEVVWGTGVTYDTLAGGTFTVGKYVRFGTGGNAGRILYDNGSTFMVVALDDVTGTITPVDTEVMTEYTIGTGASGVTAAVDTSTPVADPTKEGGSGLLLANDSSGTKHHIQLRTGYPPVDDLEIRDGTNTCDVAGSVTGRTVTPVFLGSYVGTLIGGFGIGIKPSDLTSSDTVTDLDGDVNTPPNNVTWTLYGLASGEDRILVGPKDTGDDFDFNQMTLATALTGAAETVIDVGTANIPDNTPASGTLRVELDDGRYRYVVYDSHDGDDEFTLNAGYVDWQDPDDAGIGNGVMVSYIDKTAASSSEAFTTIYDSDDTLWVRVRDGGGTPIKTYEAQSAFNSGGGSATASRISDA